LDGKRQVMFLKKLLVFALVLAMAVLLLGCTETGEPEQDEENGPEETPQATEEPETTPEAEIVRVKSGDFVKVHYTGTLEDGNVFDSSEGRDPLAFQAGAGQMIKGFDSAVIGMAVGEEKDIKLQPSEAYGEEKPELIAHVPIESLPEGQKPEVGLKVLANLPSGGQRMGIITEVGDVNITINLNHELAGKILNFHIKLVEIS